MDGFSFIPHHGHRRHGEHHVPADGPAEILWLRVSFSTHFDAAALVRWHQRLQAFLSGCGLAAAISLERVAIFPADREITSFDRGLVVGWLTAQPEVVFVHIDRCAPFDRAHSGHGGRRHD